MQHIAIIGNHTDAGKTIASAIICEALKADYWKPVQAGGLSSSDKIVVGKLLSNSKSICHPEQFRLSQPLSPHIAAKLDNINIELSAFTLPKTANKLIFETAGGLLSPINDTQTNLDLIKHFSLPVILISNNYLGSINHSLLTASVLKQNNITVLGILFNGESTPSSENYILQHTGYNLIGNIPLLDQLNQVSIMHVAQQLSPKLIQLTS